VIAKEPTHEASRETVRLGHESRQNENLLAAKLNRLAIKVAALEKLVSRLMRLVDGDK
jgi:hypothetical protein